MALAVSRTPRSSQPARATNRSSSSREQEAEMEAGQLTRDQRKLQADQQALSTKSVQLQNQENSIKQRQDALQQRENDLQKRQSAVQQRDNELQRRQTTMQQGETALQKRQTTMQEKETDLQKRLTNMQGKEKDLQSREEDLKRRDAAFRRAKDAADRVKTPNAEIQAGLEKRERDVQKRVDEVKEREAAVAALEQELQAKMADVTLDAESRNHELPDKRTDDDTVASSASVEGSRAPTPAPPEDLGTPADDVPETQTPPVVPDADDAWGAWGGGPTTVKPQESDAFSVKAGKKKKKGKK
ncbi:hypothetical protein K491DRAFT_688875 [Lophiostoma macrostomum CBS 122681]|uniref:Uncharacterized protein n=1 Tax=Lophiostoma macrostomum CBS 122681 TaxID=1314788 RepID=A0A6A6TID4_9PLEO|nr:hypothetical protein K491DRAFT_688875 [Lophiostoma macrostomum CBS 122681]